MISLQVKPLFRKIAQNLPGIDSHGNEQKDQSKCFIIINIIIVQSINVLIVQKVNLSSSTAESSACAC